MFDLPNYDNPISLIPGGCPQLLDYEASLATLDNICYKFEEIPGTMENGVKKVYLHAYASNEDKEFVDELDPAQRCPDRGYTYKALQGVAPWLGEWLPLPFLRERDQTWTDTGEKRFEYGPTDWARGRLVVDKNNPDKLRLVLAFDMRVEEKTDDIYAALTRDDVDAEAHFSLAWRYRDNAWFMDLAWVNEWLSETWENWFKKTRKRNAEKQWQFEYLASYLTYLKVIQQVSRQCSVYVVRPDDRSCVNVDLVLDIGNSRTTGILVETQAQSSTNLNNSYLLQLRDMSEPENVYTDPFETRLEFSEPSFGNDALSKRSGRRNPAFVWPSPVRIGPEAARLATFSRCEKGSTGMSSPKRYLWDEREWKRSWRFNTGTENAPYVTRGPLALLVNSSGTPLCCMDDKKFIKNPILKKQERENAFESYFTRSSLMMFLLVEIIQQALITINSPGQRIRKLLAAKPRRLRQIIFTVPGGMPLAEKKIYKRWAEWAVHVLWEAMGWSEYYVGVKPGAEHAENCDYRTSPVVRCDWDEATCTQLVFIYNEIRYKYQGDAQLFCEVMGRRRKIDGQDAPSIRVATIDMGGGTTDLSITTFELASSSGSTPRMVAYPEFHDGFNLAGDDILRAIINNQLLPAIGEELRKSGCLGGDSDLTRLFGSETMDMSKDTMDKRIQFIRQIAIPVALNILSLYEKADMHQLDAPINLRVGDCFYKLADVPTDARTLRQNAEEKPAPPPRMPFKQFPMPSQAALEYVGKYVEAHGGQPDFSIMDVQIQTDFNKVNETVASVVRQILANLCEVINLYDCDVLLLTGRPSRWPAIFNTIYSLVPLAPGRIFPMANYKAADWYPFTDALGNITDPKTTVVVGAILCALAEGQLQGFSFDPNRLSLFSTARYIGEMELDGQIRKEKVWFEVDPEKGSVNPKNAKIFFSGPIQVGFRQLDCERWTTTRFYMLEWFGEKAHQLNASRLPLRVTLEFEVDNDDVNDDENDRDEGEFKIISVLDKDGEDVAGEESKTLNIRLQTLPNDEGFWMDTGVIRER